MSKTVAIVSTKHASRYLQQLCKHFAHRLTVEFSSNVGTVSLPFGECTFVADAETLVMKGVSDTSDLARLEAVVGNHLARFAFREAPTIIWQRTD